MSNRLKEMVKKIQYVKGWTIQELAENIGYTRVHLSKAMGKDDSKKLEMLIGEKYKDILAGSSEKIHSVPRGNENAQIKNPGDFTVTKLVQIDSMQRVILKVVAELLAKEREESVAKVLTELERAVNDESLATFAELQRNKAF